jgi:hypothetical protein
MRKNPSRVLTLKSRYFQLEEAETVFDMLEKDYKLKLVEISPEAYMIEVKMPTENKEEMKLRSIITRLGITIYKNPYTLRELRKRNKSKATA